MTVLIYVIKHLDLLRFSRQALIKFWIWLTNLKIYDLLHCSSTVHTSFEILENTWRWSFRYVFFKNIFSWVLTAAKLGENFLRLMLMYHPSHPSGWRYLWYPRHWAPKSLLVSVISPNHLESPESPVPLTPLQHYLLGFTPLCKGETLFQGCFRVVNISYGKSPYHHGISHQIWWRTLSKRPEHQPHVIAFSLYRFKGWVLTNIFQIAQNSSM